MANLRPITQKAFLVQIEGLPSMFFTKATSFVEKREVVEYNDGQTGQILKMPGFVSRDNVTLSKPFTPEQDKELITWYNSKKEVSAAKFTVSITPVNSDLQGSPISGASTLILNRCEVVSLKLPEVDRLGSGLAMIEIELITENFTVQ